MDQNNKHNPRSSTDSPINPDRRAFFLKAGALGTLAAAGGSMFSPSTGAQQSSNYLARPEGIVEGGQSDSRFPVSFAESVPQGLRLVMEYFTALNQRDLEGIANLLHYPFAIYEDIEPLVYESASEFLNDPPSSFVVGGNPDRGQLAMMEGSYDMLEGVDVHLYSPVGGAFSLSFTRFTPDGNKLLECDTLLSVTNNDGRWAIQMLSTIFHERGYEHKSYPDAEMDYRLGSQGYLAQFGYRNTEILNDPTTGRGSFQPELPVGTRTASVSFGYSPRERTRNARNNEPMRGWEIDGVESRLRVSEVTEPGGKLDTDLDEFVELAGGTVGDYGYTRINPTEPLVIHATHDKAHVLGGYWRFTPAGELISETRSVSIQIYKNGVWGRAGSLGQVTHHDRSNSVDRD